MRYWTSVARTVMTGPAELLWKMINPIKENHIVAPDPLSSHYNISWSCFQGALPKVNRINQVTKTPSNYVVLAAVAGSLHAMMKVTGPQQLDNMNVSHTQSCYRNRFEIAVIKIITQCRSCTPYKPETLIVRRRCSFVCRSVSKAPFQGYGLQRKLCKTCTDRTKLCCRQ